MPHGRAGSITGTPARSTVVSLETPDGSPLRIAFLGCGFITRVHSRNLKALRTRVVASYASRDAARAAAYCRTYRGAASYGDYAAGDRRSAVDAVVIAVPPRFHLDLTLQALAAGKHVLVEKPAFPAAGGLRDGARRARPGQARRARRRERSLQAARRHAARARSRDGVIGEMVFAHFTTIAKRLKTADDWRNDESMAGGDAFFEEGHPLAAPRRQPRPDDHVDPGLPAVAVARRAGHAAPRA